MKYKDIMNLIIQDLEQNQREQMKYGFFFPFVMLTYIITNLFGYFVFKSADFITHKVIKLTDISVSSSFEMVGSSLLEAAHIYEQKKA